MTTWQDSAVRVQARLIPRFLWTTASIDVFLDDKCILRTGGQMKVTGAYSVEFVLKGTAHRAELAWGRGALRSFPYRLEIDGAPVSESRVAIQNWPLALWPSILVCLGVIGLLTYVLRG
jgi:hypothetical protein